MVPPFSPCPFLPAPLPGMDWRNFSNHGKARDAEFYFTALQYGHALWQRKLPARALLCLDRAFGADLTGAESILRRWPLPYEAMAWFLANAPGGVFIGNPRVHFQHFAGRMRPPRVEQRRWRAWACWQITRVVRPELPGDLTHAVEEPTQETIRQNLAHFGHLGESQQWERALMLAESFKTKSGPRV